MKDNLCITLIQQAPLSCLALRGKKLVQSVFHIFDLSKQDLDRFRHELFWAVLTGGLHID